MIGGVNLWDPTHVSFTVDLLTAFLLGIVHGVTPDEHTWPITFSYAVGGYSTRRGLRAGLLFSLAFAIQAGLASELAHFGIRVVIIEPGYIAPGMKEAPSHDGPPEYALLWKEWSGTDAKITGPSGRPGPELVAGAIADALENPETPLRVPVGSDAEMVLGARRQLDDAAFEAAMRKTLDFTW